LTGDRQTEILGLMNTLPTILNWWWLSRKEAAAG
jgi:hypothetical protein